ncbi:hypothetical protein Dda_3406 [Drechslerella dactyloides]|uniref:WIBG Mago-binding domain-containing protein n=1 Tax=Drechslerella dactyloides TaxID=74499 RepID=A0AAD6J1I0_DREDA|nr:hypothetical protein Dda_3406 [Drechslerella dactyloides]
MASKDPTKPPKAPKTTNAGIQTLASGSRVIPASVRADGSTRPERRVKPGFTPAEDIVKYQNKTAEAFRNRPVPGATEVIGEKAPAKKKRSRKKKGPATAAGDEAGNDKDGDEEDEKGENEGEASAPTAPVDAAKEPAAAPQAGVDTDKKAKALQKKIRQAQDLKLRKDNGEKLLPEQLDKALRLDELIRDLEKLGVKYEG